MEVGESIKVKETCIKLFRSTLFDNSLFDGLSETIFSPLRGVEGSYCKTVKYRMASQRMWIFIGFNGHSTLLLKCLVQSSISGFIKLKELL